MVVVMTLFNIDIDVVEVIAVEVDDAVVDVVVVVDVVDVVVDVVVVVVVGVVMLETFYR